MCFLCSDQGYEGERNTDAYFSKISQAKQGLDKNANKKKKKKKATVIEEGPSKTTKVFILFVKVEFDKKICSLGKDKRNFLKFT